MTRVYIGLCSDGVGAWVGGWGDADHDNTHIHMHHTQDGHAYTMLLYPNILRGSEIIIP